MGSYRWHPDEMDNMRAVGNKIAHNIYGDKKQKPTTNEFIMAKYTKE